MSCGLFEEKNRMKYSFKDMMRNYALLSNLIPVYLCIEIRSFCAIFVESVLIYNNGIGSA